MSNVELARADEDLTDDSPDYNDDLVEIRKRLLACSPSLSDAAVDGLVSLWSGLARKLYMLYEQSAQAYFSYLQFSCTSKVGY